MLLYACSKILKYYYYCCSGFVPKISINEKPRAWHIAGTYHPFNNPTQCEVIVTDGNKHYRGQTGARVAVSDTCTLLFGK